jgi:hypothetical protein
MLTQAGDFLQHALCEEKTWRVLTAISALPDRNGFAGLPEKEARKRDNKTNTQKGNIHETHTNPARNASLGDA